MKKLNLAVAVMVVLAFDLAVSSCGETQGEIANDPPGWPQFKAATLREETGQFVVDGDTLVETESALHEFYELNVAHPTVASSTEALAVLTVNGRPSFWTQRQGHALTYCVTDRFGGYQAEVAQALKTASTDWERAANVTFTHVAAEDAHCTASNPRVLFNVEPVNVQGRYLARSFFPVNSRPSRNLKVDVTALTRRQPPGLTGIFRHEMGHILGFRHEHTRPEAGACFEDDHWQALTPYDRQSVMHYPQCHGGGNPDLKLSPLDIAGARKLYPF